ncbi:MAG: extracellular solute-binding protein [Candidatus Omnitrophica bacterium]|nr:extracellular solute-binding protein [Candidatus Omnitrophota bacterium]MBU1871387.1 extracellular solute-binding protein [Candidatus Omnitrophota bacterium]
MKRLIAIVLLGCAVFGLYSCAPKQAKKPTIVVWHWMTDRQAAFEQLAGEYEQKTGIKINFELYAPSDAYSQKTRAAAQCNTLPDIFGILAEKRVFASFVKAGHVLDLYPYMQQDGRSWQDSFFAKALAVNEFSQDNSYGVQPGIYGVPLDITTIQMIYNKDLFDEMGLDSDKPPQNFEEFLAVGRQIKQAGLQGMVAGLAEIWMIDCLANNFAFNIMGRNKVLATIRGEVAYTDPDWIKVLSLFKQMQDEGLLADGIVIMVNKVAEQLFANGRAVFAFNGSWCVNVYHSMNPALNYGVMLPPKINSEYPLSIWGGAGSSFMVNARSENREQVVEFLKWLTAEEQQAYLAQATNNLPSNKECLDDISPALAQFADDMDLTTHPNTWGVSELPLVTEAWNKGIQSIIIGEKTPQEVAVLVQVVKERELAKKRQ